MEHTSKGKLLGELETEIMEIIWLNEQSSSTKKKPISVKEVTELLQKKRKIAYTTVMTVMGRLTEKCLLKRMESGKAYLYQATYSKDKFLTKVSRQIIKNFVASFGESAVANFTQEIAKISPEKRQELIKLLERE